ncbi:MAG: DUF4384 domain-containing protein [Syntrophobacter sp.]
MPIARLLQSIALSLLLLLVTGSICPISQAAEAEKRELKFRWAFGALGGSTNAPRVEPVARNAVLKSGDKLKVMVELHRKCFVYLIHHNAQGEVAMLFPYDIKQFGTDYQPGRRYYIPKGEAWFQLDNKIGKETFYLMASDQRLLDIEYLYNKYVSSEPVKRTELAVQMVAELDSLREQYRAAGEQSDVLASNEATLRGFERATGADPTDIAGMARDIAFNNLYSETIVIDHR